jgi:hypothetical protein
MLDVRADGVLADQVLADPGIVPALAEPGEDSALRAGTGATAPDHLVDLVAGEQRLLRLVK